MSFSIGSPNCQEEHKNIYVTTFPSIWTDIERNDLIVVNGTAGQLPDFSL